MVNQNVALAFQQQFQENRYSQWRYSRPRQTQSRLHTEDGGGRMMFTHAILMTLVNKPHCQWMKSPLPRTKRPASSRRQSMHFCVDFKWKRAPAKWITDTSDYNYGHVNLNSDDSKDVDAVTVFEEASDFGQLVSLIAGQSELYIKRKGIPFATNEDELRAFLGNMSSNGYHVLPSITDYWPTQPDFQVPSVANIH